jgi:hypothetical protein
LFKSISLHIKWRQVKMEWGIGKREGEREREKRLKGVGDRVYMGIGNGVG